MSKKKEVTAGRPLKIATPEEFARLANAYFEAREQDGKPITITGLVLALGLSTRQSLRNYQERPEFEEVVQRAKLRVENAYEELLVGGKNVTGAIFALKNFNWSDKPYSDESIPFDSVVSSALRGLTL